MKSFILIAFILALSLNLYSAQKAVSISINNTAACWELNTWWFSFTSGTKLVWFKVQPGFTFVDSTLNGAVFVPSTNWANTASTPNKFTGVISFSQLPAGSSFNLVLRFAKDVTKNVAVTVNDANACWDAYINSVASWWTSFQASSPSVTVTWKAQPGYILTKALINGATAVCVGSTSCPIGFSQFVSGENTLQLVFAVDPNYKFPKGVSITVNSDLACWEVFVNNSPAPVWWFELNSQVQSAVVTWTVQPGFRFKSGAIGTASVCTSTSCTVAYSNVQNLQGYDQLLALVFEVDPNYKPPHNLSIAINNGLACWEVFINNSPQPAWWASLKPTDAPVTVTWKAQPGFVFLKATFDNNVAATCTATSCSAGYSNLALPLSTLTLFFVADPNAPTTSVKANFQFESRQHSGQVIGFQGFTGAQFLSAFQSIFDDDTYTPVSGYCTVQNPAFPFSNSLTCRGPTTNIAFKYTIDFYEAVGTQIAWEFGFDFGFGGVILVDGVLQQWDSSDLWWSGSWANSDVKKLTYQFAVGSHQLVIFGAEQCCDGGQQIRFNKANTGWSSSFSLLDAVIPDSSYDGHKYLEVSSDNDYACWKISPWWADVSAGTQVKVTFKAEQGFDFVSASLNSVVTHFDVTGTYPTFSFYVPYDSLKLGENFLTLGFVENSQFTSVAVIATPNIREACWKIWPNWWNSIESGKKKVWRFRIEDGFTLQNVLLNNDQSSVVDFDFSKEEDESHIAIATVRFDNPSLVLGEENSLDLIFAPIEGYVAQQSIEFRYVNVASSNNNAVWTINPWWAQLTPNRNSVTIKWQVEQGFRMVNFKINGVTQTNFVARQGFQKYQYTVSYSQLHADDNDFVIFAEKST